MAAPEPEKLKQKGNRLYERYAKPFEEEHAGKYIAVSPKGEVVLGDTMLEVAQKATDRFGRGNFVFKLGSRTVGKWR
jgi:hypothetical protein